MEHEQQKSTRVAPLSVGDRELAITRLSAHVRTAWKYTAITVGVEALFLLRVTGRGTPAAEVVTWLLLATTMLVALNWYFAWSKVSRMRGDLKAGKVLTVRGPVSWLDRQDNAYGQTVTHVKVAGYRATSRDPSMVPIERGDYVELDILPTSRVILSVRAATDRAL